MPYSSPAWGYAPARYENLRMSALPEPDLDQPTLSVVIPLLNEEAVLDRTHAALTTQLEALGETYELIFVDDGSTDRSRAILAAKALRDPTIRVVALSRNFGHEMATTAGLRHARGRAAIVMDADLQDPPELIPEFVARWRAGNEVVYGIRQRREGESLLKKLTSFVFYRLVRRIADVPIPPDTGDFRLIDRRVLDVFAQLDEDPRFFRGLISWVGFRQVGIPFVRKERAAGRTKYRYGRLLNLAIDSITAFSTVPSQAITLTAAASAVFSGVFIAVVVALWAAGTVALEWWMWAGLGFLAVWNLQFLCLATLGEYIVRTHRHTQRRPLYVIDTIIEGCRPNRGIANLRSSAESERVFHPSALAAHTVNETNRPRNEFPSQGFPNGNCTDDQAGLPAVGTHAR
jgi:dolichol-phosphate mannosyltransferase